MEIARNKEGNWLFEDHHNHRFVLIIVDLKGHFFYFFLSYILGKIIKLKEIFVLGGWRDFGL